MAKKHKPDVEQALQAAATAMYLKDSADYPNYFWDIIRALGGQEAVDLYDEDERAFFEKYGG